MNNTRLLTTTILIVLTILGFGCDESIRTDCAGLTRALEAIPSLHLRDDVAFNSDAFAQAQSKVLTRLKISVPDYRELNTLAQCVATTKALKDAGLPNGVSDIGIEIIDAYVKTLDPHSYAILDADLANRSSSHEGYGFALEQSRTNQLIEIVEVIATSPAHSAGLKKGMILLTINNKSIEGKSLDELTAMINESPNKQVTLSVMSPQHPTSLRTVTLKRLPYRMPSVKPAFFYNGKIGYLKIFRLEDANEQFAQQLQVMEDQASVLILDLRDLAGGSVRAARDLTDWLTIGILPFSGFLGKNFSPLTPLNFKDPNSAWDGQFVVLVNSNTMSAAELMAGALQDYGAIVVGTRTFGKGTRQTYYNLSQYGIRGGVYLTDAFTVRPSGALLQFAGVTPDIELSVPKTPTAAYFETELPGALRPPLKQLPLPGYDSSIRSLPSGQGFNNQLRELQAGLLEKIELGTFGDTEEDQQLEAAKQVALFLAREPEPKPDASNNGPSGGIDGGTLDAPPLPAQLELPFPPVPGQLWLNR